MTRETIAKIVKASGVSAGELILIHFWGENADKTVADQFAAAVAIRKRTLSVFTRKPILTNHSAELAARYGLVPDNCLSAFFLEINIHRIQKETLQFLKRADIIRLHHAFAIGAFFPFVFQRFVTADMN